MDPGRIFAARIAAQASTSAGRLQGLAADLRETLTRWLQSATAPMEPGARSLYRRASFACVASMAALFAWRVLSSGEAYDDAYITYRFARNWAEGGGLRWNPTDALPVYGASSLPWALLLGLGAKLGVDPPALSLVLQASSHVALSLLAVSLVPSVLPGFLAGSLVALGYPLLAQGQGLEIELFAALCLLTVKCLALRKFGWAGFCAGLAAAVRLDGLSILATVGLVSLFEADRVRTTWRAARAAALPLCAWLLTAVWMFGSPIPQSMRAKLVSAVHPRWTFHNFFGYWLEQPVIASCLVLIALAIFVARSREFRILAAWLGVHLLEYKVTRMPGYGWYYSAPIVALCVLPFVGAVDLRRALTPRMPAGLAVGLVAALLLPVGFAAKAALAFVRPRAPAEVSAHTQAAAWIAKHTRTTDKLLAYEIGKVGYLTNRITIDMFGLVSPDVIPFLKAGGMEEVVRSIPFDYLFTRRDLPLPPGLPLDEVWACADGMYVVLKPHHAESGPHAP